MHCHGLCAASGTGDIGIDRLLDGMTFLEFLEMFDEKVEVYRIRMVEIDLLPFLHWKMTRILVIGVLWNHHHLFLKLFSKSSDYSGLSRSGSTCYSDNQHKRLGFEDY